MLSCSLYEPRRDNPRHTRPLRQHRFKTQAGKSACGVQIREF
jgi:hypothetical protein